jgi:hypothetical protein
MQSRHVTVMPQIDLVDTRLDQGSSSARASGRTVGSISSSTRSKYSSPPMGRRGRRWTPLIRSSNSPGSAQLSFSSGPSGAPPLVSR